MPPRHRARPVLGTRVEHPVLAEEDLGELPRFERAARLYRALGDARGEAEALFWVGCFHQVVQRDNATALPVLERDKGAQD